MDVFKRQVLMPRLLLSWVLMVLSATGRAAAHPHVFVDAEIGFAITDSRVSALRISWTYDEFTTLVLFDILDLDADGDGVLNEDDLANVAAGETEWPEHYNGDVYMEISGDPIVLDRPFNASAEMQGDRITVRFDLPLREPHDLSGDTANLRLSDPSYYYAYTVTGATVALPGTATCRATVVPFEADAATAELQRQLEALSREESPEQPDVGHLFADEVVLTCR